MKVIHGSRSDDYETSDFKTCPVCGAVCFSDMDTCFGCLHHFDESETLRVPVREPKNERPAALEPSSASSPEDLIDEATLSSLFVKARDLKARNDAFLPARDPHRSSEDETEETEAIPIASAAGSPTDPARDIAGLQKPKEERRIEDSASPLLESEEGLTSRHVCSDKEGRQFEISISVKLL